MGTGTHGLAEMGVLDRARVATATGMETPGVGRTGVAQWMHPSLLHEGM